VDPSMLEDNEDITASGEIQVADMGGSIRATGPNNVPDFTVVPYKDPDGRDTGIRYALGTDVVTGKTKVKYVDYPVPPFDVDKVKYNSTVPSIFKWCRICDTVDAIANVRASQPVTAVVPYSRVESSQPQYYDAEVVSQRPKRVALADVNMLPKYVPFIADVAKSLFLNKFGDTIASVIIAFGADVIGGSSSDPAYQDAWRQLSDQQIDGVANRMLGDDTYLLEVKKEAKMLIDAYGADGDIFKSILKSVTSPADEVVTSGRSGHFKSQERRKPTASLRMRGTID
jgi:hypothetical protein